MTQGSKPVDGGNLILDPEDYRAVIASSPQLKQYIHPYIGAREFINGKQRYVFWLKDLGSASYELSVELDDRLENVKEARKKSPTKEFQKYADYPWLFVQDRQPETPYLVLPRTTSGRRKYLPLGFNDPSIIASDKLIIVPDASLYDFGILSSQFHSAWMRVVSGRLKSDYEYSSGVYYNMAYPKAEANQVEVIERIAQTILDIRNFYADKSLADLYDPEKMPPDLRAAHDELDLAVEAAYGVDFNGDEEKIVAHLFKLYAEATKESRDGQ